MFEGGERVMWEGIHQGVAYEIAADGDAPAPVSLTIIFEPEADLPDFTIKASDLQSWEDLHTYAHTIIDHGGW